jgi:uncharacterized membrane protein HdeD (DUF308 family)
MALVTTTLGISAGLAILVGILILAFPKFLRWFLGIYLIIVGILQFV